ncbi:hypothetical protein ACPWT1_04075 [Ramlibacter sp. MMS24-I3-19]|uniref:hypothetical protein n=1 Tax=Ramlibacter sp. MMS24-I3-19 TaxID=3416606 RepID=UPI003D055E17
MTSFVHVDFPTEHPGVARAERALSTLSQLGRSFDGARGAATLLLVAVVASLLVVANQVIDTWTEGHLLAAWIVLWTVAFAALGLLAAPLRRAVHSARTGWVRTLAARREAAQDRELWALALTDARVMAELSRAMSRDTARDVRGYR